MTVQEAINNAEKQAGEILKLQGKEIIVNVIHYCRSETKKKTKLFDSLAVGERRDIDEGQICNVSEIRALTNIPFEDLDMPFLFKHSNNFNNIIKLLKEDDEK